jgi:hypothetical protein
MVFQIKEDYGALATLRDHRLKFYVEMHGEADPRTLRCMNEILLAYMSAKNWEAAKEVGERLVRNLRPIKDMDGGQFWRAAIQKLSKAYDFLGDYEKGIPLGEETLSFFIERDDLENNFYLAAARDLLRMYLRVEDWPNAVRCGHLAVQVATNLEGRDSEKTITYKKELAFACWQAGESQLGFRLDIDAYQSCCRKYGEVHPTTVDAMLDASEVLRKCKQKEFVLVFYEIFATVSALHRDRNPTDEDLLVKIQHGLDEFFREAPEEWHTDMLEIQSACSFFSIHEVALTYFRTKCLSIRSPSVNPPTSNENATGPSQVIGPNTRNPSATSETSNQHRVKLASLNAIINTWGMTAIEAPRHFLASTSEVESDSRSEHALE